MRGKHRDNVVVQNYIEFHNIVKPYVPKVTLLLLKQKDVEESNNGQSLWADSKAIPGVSSCHVAHCSLTGTITAWQLLEEEKLVTI